MKVVMRIVFHLVTIWSFLAATAAPQTASNPHWSKDGCVTCHPTSAGRTLPIAPEAITPLCLSCHDGAHASAEAHPVGRTFESDKMNNPLWPMPNGKIACETCHDSRQACDASLERPETNASFLRPTTAPFCASCHKPEATPKLNPHRMIADDGSIIEAKCVICHTRTMDNSRMTRSGDPTLRADVITLCRSCHPHHRDISQAGHIDVPIPADMLAYMRARELTGLLSVPSADLIKQLADEHAQPVYMIPDGQGHVVCYTCHNPHQAGTFPAMSVLSDRSLRLVRGHLLTPVRGSQFCRHCHNL